MAKKNAGSTDMPQCPSCGSDKIRIKAYRVNSISYRCKDCKRYFSRASTKTSTTMAVEVGEKDANTRTLRGNGLFTSDDPPGVEEIARRYGLPMEDWAVRKVQFRESERNNATQGFFVLKSFNAELVRKTAVETEIPAIQPIQFQRHMARTERRVDRQDGQFKKAIILSDGHLGFNRNWKSGSLRPFHDRKVWSIVFQIIEDEQPDVIILNGDMMDFPEWNDKFIRTPEMYFTSQPTLIEMAWIIRQLRLLAPAAKIIYTEGNHEKRVPKAMATHLSAAYVVSPVGVPEDYPALSVPILLDLAASDVEWGGGYPDNGYWLNGNLQVIHGLFSQKRGGATAEEYLNLYQWSTIFGHIHREERTARTDYPGGKARTRVAECFGMIGNPRNTPANTTEHNWQQAIGLAYFQEGGEELFYTERIPIIDGEKAIHGQTLYEGVDYTQALVADTGWRALGRIE